MNTDCPGFSCNLLTRSCDCNPAGSVAACGACVRSVDCANNLACNNGYCQPNRCQADTDCGGQFCDPTNNRCNCAAAPGNVGICQGCAQNTDCASGTCDPNINACTATCTDNTTCDGFQCRNGQCTCNAPAAATCQGCNQDTDCASSSCNTTTHMCNGACTTDAQCNGFTCTNGACDCATRSGAALCQPCAQNADCQSNLCDFATGECTLRCQADTDCASAGVICDPNRNRCNCGVAVGSITICGACNADADCASGHCNNNQCNVTACTVNSDCGAIYVCQNNACNCNQVQPGAVCSQCNQNSDCTSGVCDTQFTQVCQPATPCTSANDCGGAQCFNGICGC